MHPNSENALATLYTQSVERTRRVWLLIQVFTIVVFLAVFNHRFSWFRTTVLRNNLPPEAEYKAAEHHKVHDSTAKFWHGYHKAVDHEGKMKFIDLDLIGSEIYADDLPILASLALVILLAWYLFTYRRTIAIMLRIHSVATNESTDKEEKTSLLYHVLFFQVFNKTTDDINATKNIAFDERLNKLEYLTPEEAKTRERQNRQQADSQKTESDHQETTDQKATPIKKSESDHQETTDQKATPIKRKKGPLNSSWLALRILIIVPLAILSLVLALDIYETFFLEREILAEYTNSSFHSTFQVFWNPTETLLKAMNEGTFTEKQWFIITEIVFRTIFPFFPMAFALRQLVTARKIRKNEEAITRAFDALLNPTTKSTNEVDSTEE